MNKENARAGGDISEEQRFRISQNFRAAKALLDRKRPRQSANASGQFPRNYAFSPSHADAKRIEVLSQISSIKRLPLLEIPPNVPSPASAKGLKLAELQCNSSSCSRGISDSEADETSAISKKNITFRNEAIPSSFDTQTAQVECNMSCFDEKSVNVTELHEGSLREGKKDVQIEEEPGSNSFITPVRSFKSSSLSSAFGDDFDDFIFEEIDALCEQKAIVKTKLEGCSGSFRTDILSIEENSLKCEINLSSVFPELSKSDGDLNSSDNQEKVGGLKTCEDAENGSMSKEYVKYMVSLNDQQREAACSDTSVPLMIVAGPGSGKTSTIVGRVLMLLNEGFAPSNILAMTFTTAAASEMRDRIGAVTGKGTAKELIISTFHSFSLQLCRSHAEKLGRTPEFLIYGHGQQRRAIIEAVRLLETGNNKQNQEAGRLDEELNGINSPQYFKDKSKKWQKFVVQAKASGKTHEDYHKAADATGAAILQNYNDILRSCNALDYHDLINCSVKLLSDFPEVFKECQESWKAMVIDEFQDTSAMQYSLLRALASHKRLTVVGDEDQSIFSFNGADVSGFDSFRKDFPDHKEVRLVKNYRSTRCIVEAASFLIKNNLKRCQLKNVITENSCGSKIIVRECCNEDAQCAYIVDKIIEITSDASSAKNNFGSVAVLYRRQVTGKVFQTVFRDRKIPFNIHGVAFYRKKVVRAIIAMLRTTLPGCDDGSFRRVFKALLPFDKVEKKKVIAHVDKVSTVRRCSYMSAACDIFSAKISGTFKRSQLTQGRKVLLTLDMISKLVHREHSISAVITSVANMIPQKYLLEQRAVLDVDGGKLLNEDNDLRSVLQYLLDDVSEFLSRFTMPEGESDIIAEDKGCTHVLKKFIDSISERERENFCSRRHDNENAVTLTTIHQSKGLEWDTVFIVKANESEIPLLHECNGVMKENCTAIEEERRLLYVAMTRARKKLFILYVIMDSNWQMLQPSRFLKEIPDHLQEIQAELNSEDPQRKDQQIQNVTSDLTVGLRKEMLSLEADMEPSDTVKIVAHETSRVPTESYVTCNGTSFLKRFSVDDRAVVSHLFRQWARKPAFQDPKRLLDKDVMRVLRTCLGCDEAFQYANYILMWEKIPADKRALLMREKQEHFQKLRIENAMSSSAPTSKQVIYSCCWIICLALVLLSWQIMGVIITEFRFCDCLSTELGMHSGPFFPSPCLSFN
ncbi:ATP-dependent DNA helicase SRS2-like protein At4g25120 isoform X2 [Diospyros lotus]|uniref:ATP-dependent DNA helicase SRS2-like protein At4g25120 isoform X2 n=1 Tax=Diospyros lotus TaxID=55363 RepID=UPI00224D51A5|nr:ATP-dependent DNA helicase SRS2-like protein At4g25120 isoform X2 [Diospyros lotus]